MNSPVSSIADLPLPGGDRQMVRALVGLRSLAPGMLINNPPKEALDVLPGGVMEGKLPDDYDPDAPLHRTSRLDHILPREQQMGEKILEVIANLEPGEEAPVGSDDDEALHIGEAISLAKMHRLDGQIGLPADLIMATLVRAGAHVKYGRRQMTTKVSTIVPGLIKLDFAFAPLFIEGGESGVVPWKPFTLMGKEPKRKGRRSTRTIAITRPRIPHWQCEFTVVFDKRRIAPSTVEKLLVIAGRDCGFGDFRPGLGSSRTTAGKFGRFVIERFDCVPV